MRKVKGALGLFMGVLLVLLTPANPGSSSTKFWFAQTVDSGGDVGYCSSLALDSNNFPHISYYDATNKDLKYAHWTGTAWDIQTVDSGEYAWASVGGSSSLALDSADRPHISYSGGIYELKYARWTGTAWDIQEPDSGRAVGHWTSLALDSNDYPHISYYDDANLDLKYAAIGTGHFLHSGSWTGAGHGTDGWYIADFNGDGKDDIFRYVPGVSGAQVFLSDGTKFVYSGSWTSADHGTDGWYVGDFSGDGRDDIFRYVPGVSGAQVFLSDGKKFVLSGSWTGSGHGTDGWYVRDLNGDFRDDIFRYVTGMSGADVFLSDGTKFVNVGSWTGSGHGTDGWYVGDFNNDGWGDIFRYLPGVSGADVFLSTWTAGSTAGSMESLNTSELDADMMLDVYGARQTEVSFDEEAALLAPFMTRMIMGEEVSIYEIKTAYEARVARVVKLVEIRQLLQRHDFWDLEAQFGREYRLTTKRKG